MKAVTGPRVWRERDVLEGMELAVPHVEVVHRDLRGKTVKVHRGHAVQINAGHVRFFFKFGSMSAASVSAGAAAFAQDDGAEAHQEDERDEDERGAVLQVAGALDVRAGSGHHVDVVGKRHDGLGRARRRPSG